MFGGGWGVGGRELRFEMGWSGEASWYTGLKGKAVCASGERVLQAERAGSAKTLRQEQA